MPQKENSSSSKDIVAAGHGGFSKEFCLVKFSIGALDVVVMPTSRIDQREDPLKNQGNNSSRV